MSNVERRLHLEGPEPEGLKELVEAGREVPDLTPEQAERMRRSFLKLPRALSATVSAATADPDPANNSDSASVPGCLP